MKKRQISISFQQISGVAGASSEIGCAMPEKIQAFWKYGFSKV